MQTELARKEQMLLPYRQKVLKAEKARRVFFDQRLPLAAAIAAGVGETDPCDQRSKSRELSRAKKSAYLPSK